MGTSRKGLITVVLLLVFGINLNFIFVESQLPIPTKYDGFVYHRNYVRSDSIVIEAFYDPVCPDSRDSWPELKQALRYYFPRVSLIVHPFALPYHDNSFLACRALHVAHSLNPSTTFPLLESFFNYQESFYNDATLSNTRASVIEGIVQFVANTVGNSSLSAIQSGFEDRRTNLAARTSFKYGCSRGVTGTPYFFLNGIPLYGRTPDYKEWRSIIDPLIDASQQHLQNSYLNIL